MMLSRPLLTAALLTLAGCDRDDLYGESTFSQNVAEAYAECKAAEITFLTGKHALNTAFKPCGSNKFAAATFAPNGLLLYFQLTHGGHILVMETGDIETIPTETPVGGATWIRDNYLAIPLAPSGTVALGSSEELAHKMAEDAKGAWRLALYDRGTSSLELVELDVRAPKDIQHAGVGTQIAMTALDDAGVRRAYTYDPLTDETAPMMPWWNGPVESMVVGGDLVGFRIDDSVTVRNLSDGTELAHIEGAKRAIPHPKGRYVMLEVDGAPISLFVQETWRELDPEREAREKARKEQWMKNLPEWAPREAVPPELQVLDLEKKERTRLSAFYGHRFEWMPREDYWSSMLLWGVEGKQLHANVTYFDLRERLRMLDAGQVPYGTERLDWETGSPVSSDADSKGTVSSDTVSTDTVSTVRGQTDSKETKAP